MVDDRHYGQLVTLAVIAHAGSFAAAARELGVTCAAVSKRIADLEEALGVRLVHRTTRQLSLTETGLAVVARAQRMRAEAEQAFALARNESDTLTGRLRIAAPIGLGQRLVAPALSSFAARHPKLACELILNDHPVDLVEESIDIAIRGGKMADSSLRARKLGPLTLLVVAAPRYLKLYGEPRTPADLVGHDWLVFTPMGRPQKMVFEGPDGRSTIRMDGRLAANDGEVVRQWTTAALGLSLLPRFWVENDLADGRLRQLLPGHHIRGGALYALHPYGRKAPPKVRAFIDALVQVRAKF